MTSNNKFCQRSAINHLCPTPEINDSIASTKEATDSHKWTCVDVEDFVICTGTSDNLTNLTLDKFYLGIPNVISKA